MVHVMFCVVEPHPHLDGVALPDPVEDVLHLVLLVLLVLLDLAPVALVEVGDVQVLRRRQVLPAAPPHPTALRPTHYFPLTSPKSPNCSSTSLFGLFLPILPTLAPLFSPLPSPTSQVAAQLVRPGGQVVRVKREVG